MFTISIEPTSVCNRRCIHCMRDKSRNFHIDLNLLDKIVREIKEIGIEEISITGGEPALYKYFKEMLEIFSAYGIKFNIITNGFNFKEVMSLVLKPHIFRNFAGFCFSIDGPREEIHDAIRGEGSFREIIQACNLCRLNSVNFSIKSLLSNLSKNTQDIDEMIVLASKLGAEYLGFLYPFVTPSLIEKNLIPSPQELKEICGYIISKIGIFNISIAVEGYNFKESVFFTCNAFQSLNIDAEGNLTFCCNLSGYLSPEYRSFEELGNLREISLREGIVRHFRLLSNFVKARLQSNLSPLEMNPCLWCFKYFKKLEWLKKYPHSPWNKILE